MYSACITFSVECLIHNKELQKWCLLVLLKFTVSANKDTFNTKQWLCTGSGAQFDWFLSWLSHFAGLWRWDSDTTFVCSWTLLLPLGLFPSRHLALLALPGCLPPGELNLLAGNVGMLALMEAQVTLMVRGDSHWSGRGSLKCCAEVQKRETSCHHWGLRQGAEVTCAYFWRLTTYFHPLEKDVSCFLTECLLSWAFSIKN